MKYKVGNRVRIKSLDWYNENKDKDGFVDAGLIFDEYMSKFCGCTMIVCNRNNLGVMTMGGSANYWTDEMIEGLVEEEVDLIPKFGEYSDNEPLDVLTMTTDFVKEHGLPYPEGYIFKDENGNVINATKIVLEKKEKEYPKTYEECCKVLGVNPDNFLSIRNLYRDDGDEESTDYEKDLLDKFGSLWELRICRDAYWKIAGEEMGLGKPWEPDWTNYNDYKFVIGVFENEIIKCYNTLAQYVLAFPTAEMRDAFKKNFDLDIEFCKELL